MIRRPSDEFVEALRRATRGRNNEKQTVYDICRTAGVSEWNLVRYMPQRGRDRDYNEPKSIPRTGRGGRGPSKIETDILKVARVLRVPKSRAITEE